MKNMNYLEFPLDRILLNHLGIDIDWPTSEVKQVVTRELLDEIYYLYLPKNLYAQHVFT